MRKRLLILAILILSIASISIIIGVKFNNLSKPKNIYSMGIDTIKNKINKYLLLPEDLIIGDNINIDGEIEFDLDSDYYKKNSEKEYNIVKNLNDSDIKFSLKQDAKSGKGLVNLKHNIKEENVIDFKYYVADSTKYYYLSDVLDSYVDDGTCNYFENIKGNATTSSNIKYLYNYIFKALKQSLKDEYFTSSTQEENINDKKTSTYKNSIIINNKNLKEITNSIINLLNKDKKSKTIISNLGIDLNKYKIKDDILGKDEEYRIDIYTTKILYKPLKYKITHISDQENVAYIYEGNDSKGVLYYLENDVIKYKINIDMKNSNFDGKIYNSKDKKVGELRLDKNKHNVNLDYSYDENNTKYDLVYSSKYTNVKDKSYKNTKTLSFKHVENKEIKLSGTVSMKLKVDDKPKIEEDIEDVIIKKNLSEKDKEKFKNKLNNVKIRLER